MDGRRREERLAAQHPAKYRYSARSNTLVKFGSCAAVELQGWIHACREGVDPPEREYLLQTQHCSIVYRPIAGLLLRRQRSDRGIARSEPELRDCRIGLGRLEISRQHQPDLVGIGSVIVRIVGGVFQQQAEIIVQFFSDGERSHSVPYSALPVSASKM